MLLKVGIRLKSRVLTLFFKPVPADGCYALGEFGTFFQ